MVDVVENIVTCAKSEGKLYQGFLGLAYRGVNATDGDWTDYVRPYVSELVRTGRASLSSMVAVNVIRAAMELRDYYLQHVKEAK